MGAVTALCGMRDLSSPATDCSHAPCSRSTESSPLDSGKSHNTFNGIKIQTYLVQHSYHKLHLTCSLDCKFYPPPPPHQIIANNTSQRLPKRLSGKNLPANAGDSGLIPGLGRSPEGGNETPFQYSCLGNPMDRGAWRATVHGIAMSQTQLSI